MLKEDGRYDLFQILIIECVIKLCDIILLDTDFKQELIFPLIIYNIFVAMFLKVKHLLKFTTQLEEACLWCSRYYYIHDGYMRVYNSTWPTSIWYYEAKKCDSKVCIRNEATVLNGIIGLWRMYNLVYRDILFIPFCRRLSWKLA